MRYLILLCVIVMSLSLKPMWLDNTDRLRKQTYTLSQDEPLDITWDLGQIYFEDTFTTNPIGLDQSIWNITYYNEPELTWIDNEEVTLKTHEFTHFTLTSEDETTIGTAANITFSASGGTAYFGLGWSNSQPSQGTPWKMDLRKSSKGVFLDYWEGKLYLCAINENGTASTEIEEFNETRMHNYILAWSPTIVSLVSNDEVIACITEYIPLGNLSFVATISEFYDRRGSTITLDRIALQKLLPQNTSHIELIWPKIGTRVSNYEYVDFDVTGENGSVVYSWDNMRWDNLLPPWDIALNNMSGDLNLKVLTSDIDGIPVLGEFTFEAYQPEYSFSTYSYPLSYLIDGNISSQERRFTSEKQILFTGEDRKSTAEAIYTCFTADGFYLGISTDIPRGEFTRTSLHIDMDMDGSWTSTGLSDDIAVVVASPSTREEFSGVYNSQGGKMSRLDYPGIIYACSGESGLVAEYFIPIGFGIPEDESSFAFAITITQGGYSYGYPSRTNRDTGVLIVKVQNQGIEPSFPAGVYLLGLLPVFIVVGAIAIRRRMLVKTPSIYSKLQDENLDRIRTIILSYPGITLERISRMTLRPIEQVQRDIRILIERGDLENHSREVNEKK